MPQEQAGKTLAGIYQQINGYNFADKAVNVLKKNGRKAWVNEVGDIAVEPAEPQTRL